MAITKAQQARQMLKRGSKKPVKQAGATNYLGKQEMVTAPKFWLSEPGHVKAKLAYITDEEEKILIDKNLYGSLKGKPNIGPAGLPSLQGGDFGAGGGGQGPDRDGPDKPGAQAPAGGASAGGDYGGNVRADQTYGEREFKDQSYASQESINRAIERQKQRDKAAAVREKEKRQKEIREKELKRQRELKEKRSRIGFDTTSKYGTPVGPMSPQLRNIIGLEKIGLAKSAIEKDDEDDKATAKAIGEQNPLQKFLSNIPSVTGVIGGILDNIPGKSLSEMYEDYGKTEKFKSRFPGIDTFEEYQQAVLDGKISAKGGLMGGFTPGGVQTSKDGTTTQLFQGGQNNEIIPQAAPTTTGSVTPEEEVDDRTEFEKLLASRPGAFRFFADGGMADDDDPVGGIMDLESGRQMYFLGKLVKKATKTIKKIAKSPIGKAALLGGALYFGSGSGGFSGLLKKGLLKKGATDFTLANLSPMKTIGLASLASGLMTPKQEEEEQEPYLGPSIDIPAIRRDPYGAMGGAYSFYAEGGKAEPVAKKTMPLLDMDGMEKDYRETGGFVEMGRMERADDVPARLSKNEFVFTADAVRNAGDGNIDKGAEVMYNMMKNLEAGGEVSEESQGLEGARKMFQTSQRLGEVI
jgi:hypothetical protein